MRVYGWTDDRLWNENSLFHWEAILRAFFGMWRLLLLRLETAFDLIGPQPAAAHWQVRGGVGETNSLYRVLKHNWSSHDNDAANFDFWWRNQGSFDINLYRSVVFTLTFITVSFSTLTFLNKTCVYKYNLNRGLHRKLTCSINLSLKVNVTKWLIWLWGFTVWTLFTQ
jgi:hypothetical protein